MNTQAGSCMRGRAGKYAATALGAAVLALGAFAPAPAQAAAPTTLYVSQGGLDSGTCPLASPCATVSYALTQAASGATIKVSGTISDHLLISSPVKITTWPGGPAGSPAVLDGMENGMEAGTVVDVAAGVTDVTLHNLTIEHGALGILNESESTLTLADSTVTGNVTPLFAYAGIWNGGTMTIINSTIAKNSNATSANSVGAGIDNDHGTITVIASTISGNTGGGIYNHQLATATLSATIVAGNTAGPNCGGLVATSFASAGYNLTNDTNGSACRFNAGTDLVNKNPLLGPLAGNGGPTQTMLPGVKSPAANVIPNPTTLQGNRICPGTDQRGMARPGHGEARCTVGAAEVSFKKATTTSVTLKPATVAIGARVVYRAEVTPKSGTGTPTGAISFTIGSKKLCTAILSGGVAACGATNAPAGTDTVTGTYSGGGGYAKSSGTATLTVT